MHTFVSWKTASNFIIGKMHGYNTIYQIKKIKASHEKLLVT